MASGIQGLYLCFLKFLFLLLPVADVLSEEVILKWYTEAHVAKGKSVFLEQMKKFVEWLKNAEEGKQCFFFLIVFTGFFFFSFSA